jgi:hypothetical protein
VSHDIRHAIRPRGRGNSWAHIGIVRRHEKLSNASGVTPFSRGERTKFRPSVQKRALSEVLPIEPGVNDLGIAQRSAPIRP